MWSLSMLACCTDYNHVHLTLGQTNYKTCVYNKWPVIRDWRCFFIIEDKVMYINYNKSPTNLQGLTKNGRHYFFNSVISLTLGGASIVLRLQRSYHTLILGGPSIVLSNLNCWHGIMSACSSHAKPYILKECVITIYTHSLMFSHHRS